MALCSALRLIFVQKLSKFEEPKDKNHFVCEQSQMLYTEDS